MRRPSSVSSFVAMFAGSGVLHFLAPGPYASIVPPVLRYRRQIVYASGAAELVCAAAVAVPATRRRGALAGAAILLAVFPANIYMATDSARSRPEHVLALARLPLQIPLLVWAWRIARRAPR